MDDVKKLIPQQLNKLVYDTIHKSEGGMKNLAEKIGVRSGTLNNKADPSMKNHVINLYEFIAILKETGNHKILFEIASINGYACTPIQDYTGSSDMEILDTWASWSAERGETEQAIRTALINNKIDQTEIDKIRLEMYEDFQKELELLKRLESIQEN